MWVCVVGSGEWDVGGRCRVGSGVGVAVVIVSEYCSKGSLQVCVYGSG